MSEFMFARPSIFEGIGRTIDLFDIMNRDRDTLYGAEADLNALSNDISVLKSDFLESYHEIIIDYI